MSVRNSMYRMVFTLIVIPFLLFSLIITHIYSGRLERAITDSLHVVANAQVEEMTNFCEQQKEYLMMVGNIDLSRAAMRGELRDDMHQYLDNMLYSQVQVTSVQRSLAILDREYRVVACSQEHEAVAGIKPLIESMGTQAFYISNVLTDKNGVKTLVAIARIEADGELLGYILGEISLDFYSAIRERAELWKDSTFYLLDGQQQIISAGTPSENRKDFITTRQEREDYNRKYSAIDFDKTPQGSFEYTVGGKDYISYYSDVSYTDWRVLLSVSMDNYQAQRTIYFVLTFFMVLLCAILAVWIGWFASKRIIRPIQGISQTLKAIEKRQDYSLRVEVGRKDELGSLAEEINELISFIETEDLYQTQQQRLLQEKAEQDALTKVLNKDRINHDLQEAIARHQEDGATMAVLFVDIDDFKSFNTAYGHNVGDQVLLFLTSILAKETGGTVGRVGGDEFLVMIETPACVQNLDSCLKKAEEAAASRFVVRGSGTRLPVYCSIGAIRIDFSQPNTKKLTAEQVTSAADTAMYQAKDSGKRGHIIWDWDDTKSIRSDFSAT